jgi:hypothetical protein
MAAEKFSVGMAPQTCPRIEKIFPSPSPFPISGEDFFPKPNPTGNEDPTEIPVSDITKKFSLYPIPDLNPTENPYHNL